MSNGPSNIRINPFVGSGGATTYVNLTETHIIPSVSPFVIRLNEVPEKRDPSNIKAVWVDSNTGVVTSKALTEVAATPTAGQFRPDYSTKADKDDSWNTGLIEFNSADAGKIVQITYTGMGTLAAVQSNKYPNWYTDRGDGSDGDFIPSENTTIEGEKNYKSVFIKAGVTVTVNKYARILCQGAFINLGILTSEGKGSAGGAGGNSSNNWEGTVGSNGTTAAGGMSGYERDPGDGSVGGSVVSVYAGRDVFFGPLATVGLGAGGGGGHGYRSENAPGGAGGGGGGHIIVCCNQFRNNGTISSNGGNGGNSRSFGNGGGGGGGGVVHVIGHIINKGTITADGGKAGENGFYGNVRPADGGNGFVKVIDLGVL